ncbi:MAG TPA: hypothetical protein HPP97_16035 [Desulfuromonadales bacterium]|nr:hypothetical protein [Desulfuromonadales bacterium]
MRKTSAGKIVAAVVLTGMLACSAGLAHAEGNGPMTPELAAKREMVRKQQDQRITPEQRKQAAEALKAERIKVHKAKEAVGKIPPTTPAPAAAPDPESVITNTK